MKKRGLAIPKRIARAETILDIDDFFIMWNLRDYIGTFGIVRDLKEDEFGGTSESDETIKPKLMGIENLKRLMNLSHKGLLVHLKRLEKHNFLRVIRSKKNYKVKLVALTYPGKDVLRYLLDSPELRNLMKNLK